MDMEGAFRSRLLAEPVATIIENRVYWVDRPQGKALPDVTLSVVSTVREEHMKGFQALQFVRVRADCRGATYAEAKALSEAVIAAAVPPATVNGINFRRASVIGPRDRGENTAAGFIHNKQIEFIVRFSPA